MQNPFYSFTCRKHIQWQSETSDRHYLCHKHTFTNLTGYVHSIHISVYFRLQYNRKIIYDLSDKYGNTANQTEHHDTFFVLRSWFQIWCFSWFPSVSPAWCQDSSSHQTITISFLTFPIHYSLLILFLFPYLYNDICISHSVLLIKIK